MIRHSRAQFIDSLASKMSLSFIFFLCICIVPHTKSFGEFLKSAKFTEPHTKSFETLNHIKTRATPETQQKAVIDLLRRTLGDSYTDFIIEIDPNLNKEKDAFQIYNPPNNRRGNVTIRGTTGVAAATGFNYYLKYFCNSQIAWDNKKLHLGDYPEANVTIPLNDKFRYYQNVCTTSYSFVWWNWADWEEHIDWMVMNSFNLVLAFNGQEYIWQQVYKKFNLTEEEINEHFAGPAFLSWQRMGNLRGWGGPLSNAWHLRSMNLQKQILERMRSFGVIPVLPGFAGQVPRAFKRLYPNVTMEKLGAWNNFNDSFCCPYFIEPTEELFNQVGKAFLTELTSEFGTDHVYNCDSFNENVPSSGDVTYLSNVGKATYKAMTDVDPEAIWLMQGWLFVHGLIFWTKERAKALLTSVPKGKMIVLDLQSEQFPQYSRFEQYYGQPYIWCMLHNFGGTLGMFGSSSIINEAPIEARNAPNSTMVGIGLTPEGINQNYVIYDLMIENAWRSTPVDLPQWFQNYTVRRYGYDSGLTRRAWQILQNTLYDYKGVRQQHGKFVINRSPSLTITTWSWYSLYDLDKAWTLLINSARNDFDYDLVDLTRQFLQDKGDYFYNQFVSAYSQKNITGFQKNAGYFMKLFPDLENILASNQKFLLGWWLLKVKNAASSPEEERLFEYNARNQITLWGPKGEIMDYANKQWSGIVGHFFAPRWRMFIDYLNTTLLNGQPFDHEYISNKIFTEVEEPFTFDRTEFPTTTRGRTVNIARDIHWRWVDIFPY